MQNASAGDTTGVDTSQPLNLGILPRLAEEVASKQSESIKSNYQAALERLDKKDKTTSTVLTNLISQNKTEKKLEDLVIKSEKQTKEAVQSYEEVSQKLVEALEKTIETLNGQAGPKGKDAAKLTEYELQELSIQKKYGEYKKDTGLLGQLFPNAYNKFLDGLQNKS